MVVLDRSTSMPDYGLWIGIMRFDPATCPLVFCAAFEVKFRLFLGDHRGNFVLNLDLCLKQPLFSTAQRVVMFVILLPR